MKTLFLEKILPIFFGLNFLVCGGFFVIKGIQNEKNNTVTVNATVCEYEVTENEDVEDNTVSYIYSPIFKYSYDGTEYENVSSVGYGEKKYEIGEIVEIQLNPEAPEVFHVKGDNTTILIGIIASAIGALTLIYSIFSRKIRRKIFKSDFDNEGRKNEAKE